MNTGMLWFDNSNITLEAKIKKAAAYYQKKYERKPELVLVHPNVLPETPIEIEGLTIRPYRPVLPGHIWIGCEEMPTEKKEVNPT